MEQELLHDFKELDLNGDGFLTMEEMKTAFAKQGQKWDEKDEALFKEVDKNGDGRIAIEGKFLALKLEARPSLARFALCPRPSASCVINSNIFRMVEKVQRFGRRGNS